ncbi:MAG: hypothetical protein HOE90_08265 [Bacteriovoracaceae bacterium]|nr:hypothetical protein [Bacteriovoracaceae bacterium]
MAYLLRFLDILMVFAILLTTLTAMGHSPFSFGHIQIAIPSFLYVIFCQAFIMFYFIGTSRLVDNIHSTLSGAGDMDELFDNPPADLDPYKKKVERYVQSSTLSKRKTIPWTMMMLTLGMIAFFLGGAHDTGMVAKKIHVGVVYGFVLAMTIGFYRQWIHLGRTHKLLRELKALFEIPDNSM